MRRSRSVRNGLLAAAVVLVLAAPPWRPVREAFCRGTCLVLNGAFGHFGFGERARVRFLPGHTAPDGRRPTGEVTVDAILEITVDGYRGSVVQGMSLRRDIYLPLVVLLAAIAALPVAWRLRARVMVIGLLVELTVLLASTGLFLLWNLAVGLGLRGVFSLSPRQHDALDLAFRTLLLPPANRLVIPIVIAGALAAYFMGREPRSRSLPRPLPLLRRIVAACASERR